MWRLKYKKVYFPTTNISQGRCVECHANESCCEYYCPCGDKDNQQLKLKPKNKL